MEYLNSIQKNTSEPDIDFRGLKGQIFRQIKIGKEMEDLFTKYLYQDLKSFFLSKTCTFVKTQKVNTLTN